MNLQARKVILVSILIIFLVAILLFIQLMQYAYDSESQPSSVGDYFTSTAIIAHNQTLEAQIYQTQTATAQAPRETVTPTREY